MNWIIDVFHMPETIKNLIHIFAILLVVWTFKSLHFRAKRPKDERWIFRWIVFFSTGVVIGWLINGMSPVLFLWASTKTYIFFFFFISCAAVLDAHEMEYILEILCKYQYLNVILCLLEFFVLNISGDWLGGIFGIRQGANAYTNIYLMVICTYTMTKYLRKQKNVSQLLWILGSSCLIAGFTEITAFFVEIAMIMIITTFLSRNVEKKIVVAIIGVSVALIGFGALAVLFPKRFDYIYSIQSAITYLGGKDNHYYTDSGLYVGGAYSVSRLNPFEQINRYFFHNDLLKNIFGYGLGNCEMSPNNTIFQSDFYLQNKNYEYYIFSHAATFIETGAWGLLSYAYMLVSLVKMGLEYRKDSNRYSYFVDVGLVMSVMTVVLFFYNSSVRTHSGYLLFLSLCTIPVYANWKKHNPILLEGNI